MGGCDDCVATRPQRGGGRHEAKKYVLFGNLELIECVSPPMWSMELILYEEEKNDYESLTIVYFGHKDIFHFFAFL